MEKTVRIDYVQLHRETAAEALAKFTAGFEVTAKVHKLHGPAGGNPVAEITGEAGEVDSLLMDLAYDPRDVEIVTDEQKEREAWLAPGAMREWTYTVPYTVTQYKTVTVVADREPQATSNMLAAMLDAGLDVQTGWKIKNVREV
jgi:hypothetical protein